MSIRRIFKTKVYKQSHPLESYYYEINKFTKIKRNTEHYDYQKVMEYVERIKENSIR